MDYQNYEDYMRTVLGYSPYMGNTYTYQEPEDMYNYQEIQEEVSNTQDVTPLYPEIYKIVYPMVCKACNMHIHQELTKELLEQMIDDIYKNVEPEADNRNASTRIPLKNGDVRNPNSKDPEPVIKETRQTNYLLRDLIKILLLKEWGRPHRPPYRPPMPPPPPQRPANQGRPPFAPPRPRYY